MFDNTGSCTKFMLLAGVLAGSICVCSGLTQAAQGNDKTVAAEPAAAGPSASTAPKAPPPNFAKSQRGADLIMKRWGIDNLTVKVTSSGALLRFSYRVVDAGKAALVNDKAMTPYLIEEKTGLALQVPTMEKVGQLRQTSTPENGREYWMVFSNKGIIKRGSRVDVVIGSFRVEGLVVE
jgi:hypothetical protein